MGASLFSFFLQFATEETKKGPLVVFLKDIEKFMAGVETHLMRTKLESVPAGVFIIGSHIQADSRKEKVPSHSHFLCALRISLPHFISLSTV